MKRLSTQLQKGFTLIELLVVIGILGILAAALIATIDPFEQLRKGTDTTLRNTSIEVVNAMTRYYGAKNAYPWESVANGGANCNGGAAPVTAVALNAAAMTTATTGCLSVLVAQGELKSTFTSNTSILKDIFISQADVDSPVFACFRPQSKQLKLDPNSRYNNVGAVLTGCPSATSTTCHYCVQ